MFNTKFKNGKSYASCFKNGGKGIRQNYPMFDSKSGTIKTLEGEINACRKANGEKPLKWKKGKLAAIAALLGVGYGGMNMFGSGLKQNAQQLSQSAKTEGDFAEALRKAISAQAANQPQ